MVSFALDPRLARMFDAVGGQIRESDRSILLYSSASMSYVMEESHGQFLLKDYERNEPPQLFASSPDPLALQRLLVAKIGEEYRWHHKLLKIALPTQVDDIKEGYEPWKIGEHEWSLKRDGSPVPFTSHSSFVWRVVSYSYLADLPIEDLVKSYTDPEGQPCLSNFLTDRH